MEWLKKITDFIMPIEPVDEEPEKVEDKKIETVKKSDDKIDAMETSQQTAAMGSGAIHMAATDNSKIDYNAATPPPQPTSTRPPLTVVQNKPRELNVKIYSPTTFEQASGIATEILGKSAAVVNYEYVDTPVQLRICDFLNGVCYVTNGFVDKISERIVLYVPEGVDAVDIAEAMSAINSTPFRRGIFAN